MARTVRKISDIDYENETLIRQYIDHLERNNELLAQNNKYLESINEYLRKISVNTS